MGIKFEIDGAVPSKKNLLRVGKHGVYRDKAVSTAIEALEWSTRIKCQQANGGRVLTLPDHASLRFTFYCSDGKSDRDNKLTTILDVLQTAGVIQQDNIAHFNGRLILEPSQWVSSPNYEKTIVEVL